MAAAKPHMNIVIVGHVDHGKSTLVGRILLDSGQFPAHMIEKFKEEANAKGKESFALAWVFDQLKEERERGLTIDVAHKRFDTDKYYITIIDAPGHRDFVKNMITGTSQADGAILVVAAQHGVMAQTKEHMFLARTLGIKQMIIAINQIELLIVRAVFMSIRRLLSIRQMLEFSSRFHIGIRLLFTSQNPDS